MYWEGYRTRIVRATARVLLGPHHMYWEGYRTRIVRATARVLRGPQHLCLEDHSTYIGRVSVHEFVGLQKAFMCYVGFRRCIGCTKGRI